MKNFIDSDFTRDEIIWVAMAMALALALALVLAFIVCATAADDKHTNDDSTKQFIACVQVGNTPASCREATE